MSIIDLTNLNKDQVKMLNTISAEILPEFNRLSGELLCLYEDSVDWIVHPVNSRNLFHSNLFLDICLVELLKLELSPESTCSKVIVPDDLFVKLIRKNKSLFKQDVEIISRKRIYANSSPIKLFKNIYKLFRMYGCRIPERKNEILGQSDIILIDTMILENSFKERKYIDRYYTNILDFIPGSESHKIFFLPTIIPIHHKKTLEEIYENSRERIVFHCDYLGFTDYLFSLSYPLRTLNKRLKANQALFNGIDFSSFVNKELKRNISDMMVIRSLLNYRFIRRFKNENVSIKQFIDWNENQSIDKGIIKSIKKYYPESKTKGYQGFIIPTSFSFYIQPTKWECKLGVIPDEIYVTGEKMIPVIKKFNKDLIVKAGPAFRFSPLYNETNSERNIPEGILVSLPIGEKDMLEILNLVFETIQKYPLLKNISFKVKPHPTTEIMSIKKKLTFIWPKNVEIIEGAFKSAILESELMIGNGSSTCVEALAYGRLVIIVGSLSGISQNPIPDNIPSKLWSLVYEPDKLYNSIVQLRDYYQDNRDEIQNESNLIKLRYFLKTTEKTVNDFLTN